MMFLQLIRPTVAIVRATIATAFDIFLVAILTGCSRPTAREPDANSATASLPVDAVALVRIDPSMVSALHVETVNLHTVSRILRATGKVQFDESRLSRVLAPVTGQVTGLTASVGDRVRKGDPIFYLNSRDAAVALEDNLVAHHDLDLAEKTLTMTQDLFDHQAASRIALQQAQNDVAKTHLRVDRTEAALAAIGVQDHSDSGRLDPRVPVTSPVTGAIIERHVSDGQYVQLDPAPLLTIADLSTVWVEADVFERDLHLLRAGQSAEVTTTAYPDERFRAKVARVSDVVDPATRTVKVRFLVVNPALRLKPEMFATVTLFVDDVEQAITVPTSAVLTEGDRSFVYVALDDRTFARRLVETAAEARDSRRILRGVKPGDRVVTSGAILLRGQEDRGAD